LQIDKELPENKKGQISKNMSLSRLMVRIIFSMTPLKYLLDFLSENSIPLNTLLMRQLSAEYMEEYIIVLLLKWEKSKGKN